MGRESVRDHGGGGGRCLLYRGWRGSVMDHGGEESSLQGIEMAEGV